jgi:hypothetical protein
MKCEVEITETLQRMVEVEAASAEDAERQVRAAYRAGDIVLGAEDCTDVEVAASLSRALVVVAVHNHPDGV